MWGPLYIIFQLGSAGWRYCRLDLLTRRWFLRTMKEDIAHQALVYLSSAHLLIGATPFDRILQRIMNLIMKLYSIFVLISFVSQFEHLK